MLSKIVGTERGACRASSLRLWLPLAKSKCFQNAYQGLLSRLAPEEPVASRFRYNPGSDQ
jgi:hypothetical protein